MDSLSDNFEKHLSEIQLLRKQISAEKLSHENTLKQLQGAYQIIDKLKDSLRAEHINSAKLKGQLGDATSRLQTVSQQYEQQIMEVKEMIAAKDNELRRISSFLMVNDADLIRLKVVNELELTHREEVEKISLELCKKQAELSQLQSNYTFLSGKNEHLLREMRKQEEEHRENMEQLNNKYNQELKETYQLLQRERSQHSKWAKKYQMLENRAQKQTELYKTEINKLNNELRNENKSLLSNSEAKTNKHRLQKYEEELAKLKEELANQKHSSSRAEEDIARLRKQAKGFRKIEQESALEKDRLLEEIEGLKRDILAKEGQNKKALEAQRRQLEQKSDSSLCTVKEGREKLQKMQLDYRRASFRIQQLQMENQALKDLSLDKNIATLKRDLSDKSQEIIGLKEEIRALKKREGEKRGQEREQQGGQLRSKLQEANEKIVELLKEKISLKKEIAQLRGKQ